MSDVANRCQDVQRQSSTGYHGHVRAKRGPTYDGYIVRRECPLFLVWGRTRKLDRGGVMNVDMDFVESSETTGVLPSVITILILLILAAVPRLRSE